MQQTSDCDKQNVQRQSDCDVTIFLSLIVQSFDYFLFSINNFLFKQ